MRRNLLLAFRSTLFAHSTLKANPPRLALQTQPHMRLFSTRPFQHREKAMQGDSLDPAVKKLMNNFQKGRDVFSPIHIVMLFTGLPHYAVLPNRRELYNLETFLVGLGKIDFVDNLFENSKDIIEKINENRVEFTFFLMLSKPEIFKFSLGVARIHDEVLLHDRNHQALYLERWVNWRTKIYITFSEMAQKIPMSNGITMGKIRSAMEKKFGLDVFIDPPTETMCQHVLAIKSIYLSTRLPLKEFLHQFDLDAYMKKSGFTPEEPPTSKRTQGVYC